MSFLIWKKTDLKILLGVMIGLIITVLMVLPPNQWEVLIGYFSETPPLLILGQLGIFLICSSLLTIVIVFIWGLLK